jgi:type III secretion protein Q
VVEATALMQAVAGHLSEQLAVPVSIEARLHDGTLQPLTHLAKLGAFAVLELNGDGLAVLELDMMSVGALLRYAAGASIAAAAPFRLTRIEEAALGWLLLSALSAVRGVADVQARYAPRLVSLDFDRGEVLGRVDARRKHLSVSLALRVKDTTGTIRLILPSTWLQTVLESVPEEAPGPLQPSVARASLEAVFIVGSMMLSRRDAEQLGPGDVLVFPGVTIDGVRLRGPGRVVTSSFELAGTFAAQGLTLTRAIERPALEPPMSSVDPSVPVEVEIELTRLRVPLDQLGVLKPGAVVPLHINAAQTVVLRVGDRAVARAELVEVEGEIGARILSML